MKEVVYLLVFLCVISFVSAATIHGTIYDISLDKAENVIVEVNTKPKQQYISKNGTYSFNVPIGEHTIEAKHYSDGLLESSTTEGISIKGDGDFVLDLILFPNIDYDLGEIDEINLDDDYFQERVNYPLIISIAVIILLLIISFLIKKSKKKEVKKEITEKGDYYDQILSIIKENKRITQKEIRKEIPLSEAKISLIIAELEHKGLIEKIKRGRGNIIILKK